jgi:very-short-patch-repair endonuclease
MRKGNNKRGDNISKALKKLYNGTLPPHHLAALRKAHKNPITRERHRQATIRQLANSSHKSQYSPIEIALQKVMRQAGISFVCQQKLLDRYVVDFLVTGKKLVIEADGWTHRLAVSKRKDQNRDRNMMKAGFTVLRLRGASIMGTPLLCVKKIQELMDKLPGEVPSVQTVICKSQRGSNNPMWGHAPWNKGMSIKTNKKWKQAYEKSRVTCKMIGLSEIMKARWVKYRARFDWKQMMKDYKRFHSVNIVAKMHSVGRRQLREYLRSKGVILDGQIRGAGLIAYWARMKEVHNRPEVREQRCRVHNRPEVKERHRQASLKLWADRRQRKLS